MQQTILSRNTSLHTRKASRLIISSLFGVMALLLAACGGGNGNLNPAATPTAVQVNVFGTAANHPHALLAFKDHTLLLATHYGLFWSNNGGTGWSEVAGGANQVMGGLMTYSLTSSPLNEKRIYVLTQPALNPHKGTLGLYTSSDKGHSWQMAIPTSSVASDGNIYLAAAGNSSPDEVFIYVSALGPNGLKVSKDDGQHFSTTGPLPFGDLTALLPIPGSPGTLLASSSEGMARSTDDGEHWMIIKSVTGGIFGGIVTSGPGKPIYAAGDEGVYASNDGGQSFTLVNSGVDYGSLTVAQTQPQMLYGRTGTGVYHSTNGGKTWSQLPHIAGNLFGLAADPNDASQVYLSLSYPTEVYYYNAQQSQWQSLTPKA
ncbi:MAG TPA: sialidase family protein [Ktedonobacteraceae bacterium]|jgi:photosystem II stability/assembly factor-like uncharacterized protein